MTGSCYKGNKEENDDFGLLLTDFNGNKRVLPLFPLVGMPVYSVLTVSSFMPSNSNLKYSSSL